MKLSEKLHKYRTDRPDEWTMEELSRQSIQLEDGLSIRKVYVVAAYRFGDKEKHSYVVGVYNSDVMANYVSDIEEVWRAKKYVCEVTCFEISDKPCPEKLSWFKQCSSKQD